ncbi:MAG: AraC family transcriptional regulator [Spirochaetales bacterium]|nr:MAG: AraC family transcriptional regulator [Spirochaetales bacterium]
MMRKNEEPVWHTSTDILHCFHSIGKSLAQVIEGGSPSKLGIHINELFLLIYEMFQYRKIPLNRSLTSTIRNVELFLNEIGHNLSEPWTLETMSEACGVGITRFVHYCIKIKNMTPMQYLNKIRLEKAAELLGHGRNEKILDIALQCGFNSSQYFSTIFKQHFHETPSGYKKNLNAVIS